jgi:DNA-binding IclR family transcriptional regulator
MKGPKKSKPIGVLTKTFRILEDLRTAALTLKEISEQTKINKSTALRILAHLESEAYVERDAEGRYRLAGLMLQLGSRSRHEVNLRDASGPPLRELWRLTQETVNLGILEGLEVVYLESLESPQSFRLVAEAGTRAVAYRTALGKAILAHLPAEEAAARIDAFAYQPYTPKTIVSAAQLREELDRVRREGYAMDDEESVLGVRCLAVAVLNHEHRPIAGISISGPISRMADARLPEFAAAIRTAAWQTAARYQTASSSRMGRLTGAPSLAE